MKPVTYYQMQHKYKILAVLFLAAANLPAFAWEGMWQLPGIPDSLFYALEDEGCELEAADFYSEQETSLKDNCFYLSNGFSGTLMSKNGLVLTTFDAVKDYIPDSIDLGNGFLAASGVEEVRLGNLYALKPVSAENLQKKVLATVKESDNENVRKQKKDSVCEIERLIATDGPFTVVDIKDNGKGEPVLYKYTKYPDLRLCCIPPAHLAAIKPDSIAGAVTSHDADFAFLRIYVSDDNTPAVFDSSNVAARFDRCAVISVNGYDEHDAVFALGFPNLSRRNISSAALTEEIRIKDRIVREISEFTDSLCRRDNSAVRLRIDNREKYIEKQNTIGKKTAEEDSFTVWAANHPDFDTMLRYANIVPLSRKYYERRANAAANYYRLNELIRSNDMLATAQMIESLNYGNEAYILPEISRYFTDLDLDSQRRQLEAVLDYIESECDSTYQPGIFNLIRDKYKGKRDKFFDKMFAKSILTSEKRFVIYLDSYSEETKETDMMLQLYRSILHAANKAYAYYMLDDGKIKRYMQLYDEGRDIADPIRQLRPDANYTLRLGMGRIEGYVPTDGILVQYATSPAAVPGLINAHASDSIFTLYADSLDDINCNFLCSCDMAGDKAGHGIYDIRGEFLGMLHGNNAESVISEYAFDGETGRAFAVDMDYILFILRNYMNAGKIADELEFGEPEQTISIQYGQKPALLRIPVLNDSLTTMNDSLITDSSTVWKYAVYGDTLMLQHGDSVAYVLADSAFLRNIMVADSMALSSGLVHNTDILQNDSLQNAASTIKQDSLQ